MKRKFWLERHGATEFNGIAGSPDLIRGWIDLPLNKEGRDEAAKVAERMAGKVEMIYCSDLLRARQTAEALKKTNPGAKIIPTKGLRPWDLGSFTGKNFQEIRDRVTSFAKNKPDQPVPNGESFNSFRKRAFRGIHDCLSDDTDVPAVLVTHHRVERLIKAWIDAGEPGSDMLDWATFLKKGEPTGKVELLSIDLDTLAKAAKARGEKWEDRSAKGDVAL